ncbi:MAG: zinc-ribbon domain-containing protein [Candidatus Thorarchaeota archaeon]
MVQKSCKSCGASISDTDNKCPACGKVVAGFDAKKDYSRVLHQQGRVSLDTDWKDSPDIEERETRITGVRCSSCGAISSVKSRQCPNCGASF